MVLKKGQCEITDGFHRGHNALDLVGKNYTLDDIVCHSDGVIVRLQDGYSNMKGSQGNASYGNFVKVKHNSKYSTLYAHLKRGLPVKIGDKVKKGAFLGKMSDSGNAYGKHLHFEVFKNNQKINPMPFLNKLFQDDDEIMKRNDLKYKIGDKVRIDGVYESSISNNRLIPLIKEGTITKIISRANNPYLLDDGKIGWVNNQTIITKIEKERKYLSNSGYYGFSIVDGLKGIDVDSSYNYRAYLAKLNNISNYRGTAFQNTEMLNLLKQGKLQY